jgi:ribonuclease HI
MINADGAFDEESEQGGIGVAIRDHYGKVIFTAWKFIQREWSAEEIEALACMEGLMLAAEWCPKNMELVTYYSSVEAMLTSKKDNRSVLKFIIDEVIKMGHRLLKDRYGEPERGE